MTSLSALLARNSHGILYVKLVCVALLWGGTFIAGRMLAGEIDPVTAATGRFGVALSFLVVLLFQKHGCIPVLTRAQLLGTLGLGATGVFLYNVFFFAALTEMPASRTALFVAFTPILVTVLGWLFHRGKGERVNILGILTALLGVLIVVTDGNLFSVVSGLAQTIGAGEIYMIIAALSWSFYTLLGRNVLSDLSPLVATTYAAGWGFLLLLLLCAFSGSAFDYSAANWRAYGAILYLAIGGTVVPFIWYYQGIAALGPARSAVFTNLVPVFGVLLGYLLLQEPLSFAMAIGGVLTILGVSLTNRPFRKICDRTNAPTTTFDGETDAYS